MSDFKKYMEIFNEAMTPQQKNVKLNKTLFNSKKGTLNNILSQAFKYISDSDIKPEKLQVEKTKLTQTELEELKKVHHKVDVYILLIENVDKAEGRGKEENILKSNFSVELCVLTTEKDQVHKQTYNLSSNDMTTEKPAKFICRRLLYNTIHLL